MQLSKKLITSVIKSFFRFPQRYTAGCWDVCSISIYPLTILPTFILKQNFKTFSWLRMIKKRSDHYLNITSMSLQGVLLIPKDKKLNACNKELMGVFVTTTHREHLCLTTTGYVISVAVLQEPKRPSESLPNSTDV